MPHEFNRIEGSGLLKQYPDAGYQTTGPDLEDALGVRRQKLAAHKIGLYPEPDSDPDWKDTED